MFGQKEFVQKAVYLQEPFAVQDDLVALHRKKAPILEALHRLREMDARVRSKFILEVSTADVAQFQLQDELTDVAFVRGGSESAVNWKLTGIDARYVRLEIVVILIMHSADVPEGRNSEGEQIGPSPEPIAVKEFRFGRVFNSGVGAGYFVTGAAEFVPCVI